MNTVALASRIGDVLERNGIRQQPAMVGFSGGADSTALLMLLSECGWKDLLAVHFNHHLRGAAADADQQWCRDFCAQRNIAFRAIDLYVPDEMRAGESMETAARRCRIAAWRNLAEGDEGRRMLFLGHHADDRLEEFLLRLGRGANATGLTSLRVKREFDDGRLTVCRPLLDFHKSELENYLRENGIFDWRIDATNLEDCCRRNAIRNRLLPLLREIFGNDRGFRQSQRVLMDDALYIEGQCDAALLEEKRDVQFWRSLPRPVLQRVLRQRLPEVAVSADTVERVAAALHRDGVGQQRVPLGGGLSLVIDREGLMVTAAPMEKSCCAPELRWHWRQDGAMEWMGQDGRTWQLKAEVAQWPLSQSIPLGGNDMAVSECFLYDDFPETIHVRGWRAGDRVCPFGFNGHHRKLQDVFSDAYVVGVKRYGYPILADGTSGRIIWLPTLLRAEFGRIPKGYCGEVIRLSAFSNISAACPTSSTQGRFL